MSTDVGRTGNFSNGAGYTAPVVNSYGGNAAYTSWTGGSGPNTITFPHIEHAIAGIELPNILGGVLC